MIIQVDIDGTICELLSDVKSRFSNATYADVRPYTNRIQEINALKENGHYIIYMCYRLGTDGIDLKVFTQKQLQSWGAKYDLLNMANRKIDIYISDIAYNSESWFHARQRLHSIESYKNVKPLD
jgi:hypothetical protein